jgi:hypothetical protein
MDTLQTSYRKHYGREISAADRADSPPTEALAVCDLEGSEVTSRVLTCSILRGQIELERLASARPEVAATVGKREPRGNRVTAS